MQKFNATVLVHLSPGTALLDAIVADARSNAFRLTLLKAYKPGFFARALRLLCLSDIGD